MDVRISQQQYRVIAGSIRNLHQKSIREIDLVTDLMGHASECDVEPKGHDNYLVYVDTPLLRSANRNGRRGGAFKIEYNPSNGVYSTVDYLFGFSKPQLPVVKRMHLHWY